MNWLVVFLSIRKLFQFNKQFLTHFTITGLSVESVDAILSPVSQPHTFHFFYEKENITQECIPVGLRTVRCSGCRWGDIPACTGQVGVCIPVCTVQGVCVSQHALGMKVVCPGEVSAQGLSARGGVSARGVCLRGETESQT